MRDFLSLYFSGNRLFLSDTLHIGMRERNEDGQYVETIDPESVLRAVREAYKVVTTEDVANSLGISQEAARQKLTKLEEQGEIHREDSVVWWSGPPWPTDPPEDETAPERKRRQRRAGEQAVPAIVDHLKENDYAEADELKEIAWQSGGDVYIEDKDTLWDAAKPQLVAHHDVDPGGMGPWKHTGET